MRNSKTHDLGEFNSSDAVYFTKTYRGILNTYSGRGRCALGNPNENRIVVKNASSTIIPFYTINGERLLTFGSSSVCPRHGNDNVSTCRSSFVRFVGYHEQTRGGKMNENKGDDEHAGVLIRRRDWLGWYSFFLNVFFPPSREQRNELKYNAPTTNTGRRRPTVDKRDGRTTSRRRRGNSW